MIIETASANVTKTLCWVPAFVYEEQESSDGGNKAARGHQADQGKLSSLVKISHEWGWNPGTAMMELALSLANPS